MGFNVLKESHVMVSNPFWELHDYLPPPGVIKPFPVPHMCGAILVAGPWGSLSAIRKVNDTGTKEVFTTGDHALSRGHDIGPLIPHYNMIPIAPPNLLLVVIIPTSGSKAYFGSSSVLFEQGAAAFAVASLINFNLNCSGITMPPLPSGVVFALPQTVLVGATVGDILGGIVRMVVDSAIQFGLGKLFGSDTAGRIFGNIAGSIFPGVLARLVGFGAGEAALRLLPILGRRLAGPAAMVAEQIAKALLPTAVALLIGSPVGYSPGLSPVGSGGYGLEDAGQDALGGAIDSMFDDPKVHTFD